MDFQAEVGVVKRIRFSYPSPRAMQRRVVTFTMSPLPFFELFECRHPRRPPERLRHVLCLADAPHPKAEQLWFKEGYGLCRDGPHLSTALG